MILGLLLGDTRQIEVELEGSWDLDTTYSSADNPTCSLLTTIVSVFPVAKGTVL